MQPDNIASQDNFNIFLPFDSITKSVDKAGKTVMKIGGVISNSLTGPDLDGETIDVEGMDFTKFLSKGFINYQHLSGKDPSAIIGEPIKAYVKDGKAHFEGILYPESEMAQKVYDLANVLNKSSSTRRLGYSIEGKCEQRDEKDPKRIRKSSVSGLAVTPSPKCFGTELSIIKGAVEYETIPNSDLLIDITDENGIRITVDRNLEIVKGDEKKELEEVHGKDYVSKMNKTKLHGGGDFKKSMEAGSITGRDTSNQSLTQQSLKEESIAGQEGKKKKDYKKLLANLRKRRGETNKEADEKYLTKSDIDEMLIDLELSDEEKNEVFELAQEIEKGGEGSKGGKIIGHTSKGNPIYQKHQDYANSVMAKLKSGENHQTLIDYQGHKQVEHIQPNKGKDKGYARYMMTPNRDKKSAIMHNAYLEEHEVHRHITHAAADREESKEKSLSKSEIYTSLLNDHNLDIESAKRVYELAEAIEKKSK